MQADAESWRPGEYHAAVEAIVADRANRRVDRDATQLGFFSFSKLLMSRDLALDAWPENAMEEHELTRGLLHEGFGGEAPLFGPRDRLNDALPPEKLFHVVDADASQAKVIDEVRAGRDGHASSSAFSITANRVRWSRRRSPASGPIRSSRRMWRT